MQIEIVQGDITKFGGDAIVNAANVTLLGGGGVDGCIHRAAGPALQAFCKDVFPEVSPGVRCPTGEVRITPGFDLPARFIIHTVGPIFRGSASARSVVFSGEVAEAAKGYDPEKKLAESIESCLEMAERMGAETLAMPAISCGVFGCSIEKFVACAKRVLAAKPWSIDTLTFVLFQDMEFEAFKIAWEETQG